MTNATPTIDLDTKIAELQKRVQQTPLTQIDTNGDVHIVFQPLSDQPTADLDTAFKAIRDNFKIYTTKAKHHINSHFLAPNTEKRLVERKFAGDKELQKLAAYLDIVLLEFAQNVERFSPSVKDSGYELQIKIGGKNNYSVSIGFKNKQGKEVGPFLETHVTTSPLNLYDFLSVNIGYIDKHKQRVYTHSFDYDLLNDKNLITEQRGNETHLKTEAQIMHDKFSKSNIKEIKSGLRQKHFPREL